MTKISYRKLRKKSLRKSGKSQEKNQEISRDKKMGTLSLA